MAAEVAALGIAFPRSMLFNAAAEILAAFAKSACFMLSMARAPRICSGGDHSFVYARLEPFKSISDFCSPTFTLRGVGVLGLWGPSTGNIGACFGPDCLSRDWLCILQWRFINGSVRLFPRVEAWRRSWSSGASDWGGRATPACCLWRLSTGPTSQRLTRQQKPRRSGVFQCGQCTR